MAGLKKTEALKVLTKEGKKAVKDGTITQDELAAIYKMELVQRQSIIGNYPSTFNANFDRIPDTLKDKLSPAELAELVDAFYRCYNDKNKLLAAEN